MSWTDEEIDNLFKDGANAQSFEYDNSYFSEIEAALPVNRKGKDFLWLGTALVFIAVLTTGYFASNSNDTSFNTMNGQLAELELNTANENMNTSNESETSAEDQNETVLNNTNANDLNNQLSNVDNSNTNANANSAAFNVNSGNSNFTNVGNNASTKPELEVRSNSMYNIATRNVGASRTINGNQSNDLLGSAGQNEALDSQESGSSNQIVDRTSDAEANGQKESTLQSVSVTASLNVNEVNELDQNLDQNLAPSLMPIGLGKIRPKASLYAELNAGASQSLITPSEDVSKSIGGGIGIESYFGNFNLTTGVNFKASYHDDLFLTRTGKVYGFGSSEGKNEYDVRRIYSIEMPITLGYNFGRHNVNLGVRPSFVVGAQTHKRVLENNQQLRIVELNGLIEEEVDGENISALMRFGVKPTLGYSYRINNWTIGANVGVQLMKSVDEVLIDGYNNKLPIDGQIYLRRTIRLRK